MSFIAVLKLISYILCALVPTLLLGKYIFSLKSVISAKEETIGGLRNLIIELSTLEGDKIEIEVQKTKIKNKLDAVDSNTFDDLYTTQLSNIPRR